MNNLIFKALFIISAIFYVSACAERSIVDFDDSVLQVNDLNDFDNDGVIEQRDLCENTTLGALIDNDGCGQFHDYTEPYFLDVHFLHNSYVVPDSAYGNIKSLANILKEKTNINILIEGHSSKVGTRNYNQILSTKRAQAVANVLIHDFGVKEQRISTIGYGFEKLLDVNDNEEAHQVNRRIVIESSYTKKEESKKWTIYSVDELK